MSADYTPNDIVVAQTLYDNNLYQEAAYYYLKSIISGHETTVASLMLAYIYYRFGSTNNFNAIMKFLQKQKIPLLGLYKHLKVLQSGSPLRKDNNLYNRLFEKDFVTKLYRIYLPEIKSNGLHDDKDLIEASITRHFDYEILYFIIRLIKPRNVIEFSPQDGLSTTFIYKALVMNNHEFSFATFDIIDSSKFYERMSRYNINLKITVGDAIATIPHYLKENGLLGNIDLCFIDSAHTYDFAEQYTTKILPLLGSNTTLVVHDICYCPEFAQTKIFHYGDVSANNICGHALSFGEAECIRKYFRNLKGYRFFLTHKLFGGFGILSPKIDINMDLIEHLRSNIDGFIYKIKEGPNSEDRKIPCLLIAIPEKLCDEIISDK